MKDSGFSRGGQSADDMQAVEGKGSCRRTSTNTDSRSVQRLYDGVPDLVLSCGRRMGIPNPRDAAIDERPCKWYLRWLRRTLIPTDARLTVSLLESLSHCARSVVLVVTARGRRAYKRSKADTRGTVVTTDTERSLWPGFLVAQT
jgi:hypothetical protein